LVVLDVKNLTAGYDARKPVIKDLSFELGSGETLGLCGASGCGKTTVIWAVLGMLRRFGGYADGEVLFRGRNLLDLGKKQWKTLRWSRLALVPQSSMSALNPVFTIGRTFDEMWKVHKERSLDSMIRIPLLLNSVGLELDVLRRFPHELSGGMKQRVSIALAMIFDPEILILDEATSGLDVIIEADILKLMHDLQGQRGLSMIFVSHDRRITAEFCHRRINL
jgi:peptide/nickel transport system ATP-binding protein